jgi:hypothetical protein
MWCSFLHEEFKKEHGIDLKKDAMALQRLKEAGEKANPRCVKGSHVGATKVAELELGASVPAVGIVR